MRRAIARSMSASAAIPQFTLDHEVNVAAVTAMRHGLPETSGVSVTDFITTAVARALVWHPRVNATYLGDEGIRELAAINIGLVYAVADGLLTPPIRDANRLSLLELAMARHRLAEAVRDHRVSAAELADVTFTISNLGPLGIRRFRALVVPPQAAILAVGASTESGLVALSLSCDHRVLDGAPAAAFLRDVVELVEEPSWMETGPKEVK
jgi:pyruvate dehydrogenase E2 component (dihydrolipoamide acetyltransferase)